MTFLCVYTSASVSWSITANLTDRNYMGEVNYETYTMQN